MLALLGAGLVDDREHIGLAKDQILFVVDGDFAARVLAIQNTVTGLELHRYAYVLLVASWADRDDLALLRLFLGSVGDEQPATHLLGVFERPHDDAVGEGCDFGGGKCLCCHMGALLAEKVAWNGMLLALDRGEC